MYQVEQFLAGRKQVLNLGEEPERGCPKKLTLWVSPGESMQVRCRKCPYCLRVRRRECFGRIASEAQIADVGYFGTLTYGQDDRYRLYVPPREEIIDAETGEILQDGEPDRGDHRHAHHLFYEDVQIYMKRMRHNLIKVDPGQPASLRYFVSGEYGAERGRAHWHLAVFLRNCEVPNMRFVERYMHEAVTLEQALGGGHRYKRVRPLWQDGFSYWEPISELRIGYLLKYLGKQWDTPGCKSVAHGSASLGVEFYEMLADEHARQGISPQHSLYQIPGHLKRDAFMTKRGIVTRGVPEYFPMTRATAAHFVRRFAVSYRRIHGHSNWPCSEWVDRVLARDEAAEWHRAHVEALIDAGADAGEFGTIYDQAALAEALDRYGHRDRMMFGLVPGPGQPAEPDFNAYQAASKGW